MKATVFCEKCDKPVKVKEIRISKEGRMYLYLKCGHFAGFVFAGVISVIKEPNLEIDR